MRNFDGDVESQLESVVLTDSAAYEVFMSLLCSFFWINLSGCFKRDDSRTKMLEAMR